MSLRRKGKLTAGMDSVEQDIGVALDRLLDKEDVRALRLRVRAPAAPRARLVEVGVLEADGPESVRERANHDDARHPERGLGLGELRIEQADEEEMAEVVDAPHTLEAVRGRSLLLRERRGGVGNDDLSKCVL